MKLQKLWNIDPGYFRLKHAFKTILTILIVLGLMRHETMYIKLIAGLVAGFSMQGVVSKSFSSRIIQVLILDIAYFTAFVLGLAVRESVSGSGIVLVALGFIANYMRRFGLQLSNAPMMVWTICFFATILPFTNTDEVWNHLYVLVAALLVSASVNLLIFPENYPRLFVANSNRLFDLLAQGMREIRQVLQVPYKKAAFERLAFILTENNLTQLLASNQAIAQSDVFNEQADKISDSLIQQYTLVHGYSMMVDAYRALFRHKQQLPQAVNDDLNVIYSQFELIFASLTMQSDCTVLSTQSTESLLPFVKTFQHIPLTEPVVVIVLLNLKLSFNLFKRHITKIVGTSDET